MMMMMQLSMTMLVLLSMILVVMMMSFLNFESRQTPRFPQYHYLTTAAPPSIHIIIPPSENIHNVSVSYDYDEVRPPSTLRLRHSDNNKQQADYSYWANVSFPPVPAFMINTHDPIKQDIYISGAIQGKTPWDVYLWTLMVEVAPRPTDRIVSKTVMVDVGANIGYFALMSAAMGYDCVIAFEPMAHNLAKFQSSILRNSFENIITLYPYAASFESRQFVHLEATHETNQGNGHIVAGPMTGHEDKAALSKGYWTETFALY